MKANTPSRRGFLRGTGLVAMALATGGTIILAPDYTWALSTTAIDVHTAQTLLVMARQLFPHDRLGEQYYAVVVDALDKQAAGDPASATSCHGVAQLDAARGIAWFNSATALAKRYSRAWRDRVLHDYADRDHQQPLQQFPGLSVLRLRRTIGPARRLHRPRLRRHRLAAQT